MTPERNDVDKHDSIAPPSIDEILHGTAHALTIFRPESVSGLSIFFKRDKPYLVCYASEKNRPAKPEEIVRQLYIQMLIEDYGSLPSVSPLRNPYRWAPITTSWRT